MRVYSRIGVVRIGGQHRLQGINMIVGGGLPAQARAQSIRAPERRILGVIGPPDARFANWVLWSRDRFKLVIEDVRSLLRLQIPDRPVHVGLSGLVAALGLLVFLWLAVSGMTSANGHNAVTVP
jgi:hypothetical protein